ncbi:endonuclease Q family protein [Natranaerobius trueperi]|uniref:TIGR00375 family protein n=1 Tax=Natranaerobius trueperi TaxID=759412 RepID=A0A226BYY9_9FIRM|nr:endonuclease Q family protein [Natranaerobius trueperi]OWZ83992.1 TIGR00375 family protein [Natranaerobius trueperi]
MKKAWFVDLHIHIGQTQNKPVKITASNELTLCNILEYSKEFKGLDMVGVVDCASPPVIDELDKLIKTQVLEELPEGGLIYKDELVLIPGCEVEISVGKKRAHFLAYFPNLETIKKFSEWISNYITNVNLSSQLLKTSLVEFCENVQKYGGFSIPAHAFTPHKSLFGACIDTLDELDINFKGLELGLSADTYIAEFIPSIKNLTYFTNSDAHSLPKIAREYNKIKSDRLNFTSLSKMIEKNKDESNIENFGLHPELGKYYRTFCLECNRTASQKPPVVSCLNCKSNKVVLGVLDRITQIVNNNHSNTSHPRNNYKNYNYQVPLENIPGIGKKTYESLIKSLGTELDIIHNVQLEKIEYLVTNQTFNYIRKAREGKLSFKPGGGGHYGSVQKK